MSRWLLWLWLVAMPAAALEITHRPAESGQDQRVNYFVALLALALEKTAPDHGPARARPFDQPLSQARAFEMVARGELDLVWSMASRERMDKARAVPVPLLKGLLGYRVLLAHPQSLARLGEIGSLSALGGFTAIQGEGWPDVDILRANGLEVQTATDYDGMFRMVMGRRVDYFPRSVAEVWPELARHSPQALAVVPGLVLYYPAPIYFFVHPDNRALAGRLETGLRRAVADGSFERLFLAQEEHRRALAFIGAPGLRRLALENPLMPDFVPPADPRLWLGP
ncbi:hypothetical protein C7I36_04335 [Zobellella taiwanensis]|uniref:Solute-binding protein family 3/N-terminal domain-containing protein n=1 Tax=Zobellella taiwanensis TaxID=347535 RepID=A0A2P7R6Z7_9GAMM|nr:hypothetical protein [Zobellella taiwanensis]PSJ45952.1 hypothetical protein C7I36_04335 [Zobellella taiwanensis]